MDSEIITHLDIASSLQGPASMRRSRRPFVPQLDRLEEIKLLATVSGYTPTDFRDAYNLNVTYFNTSGTWVAALGTGQTIAIVDAYHDPNLASDLAKFDSTFKLPVASLTQVNLAGTASDDGWAEEEALDVEWAHVAAAGAKLIVVEAASDSITDLMNAVNVARNIAGVSVVSMSWGGSEFSGQSAYDSYFTTPAGHTPITFVAATGDSSAFAGAEWPASSPNVLAVGGTTLRLSSGSYGFETAWSGSGGGLSQVEGEPGYQASVQSTGVRTLPDVSINANPNTGYYVLFTAPSTGVISWQEVGGTSASAQVWAGFIADADQGRAMLGLATLNGTTQTLPALYALPSSAFHDVTSGSNGYRATSGYDLATGLGTPIGNMVIPLLAYYTGSTPLTTTTVSTSATNRGRGGFPFLTTSPSTSTDTSTSTSTALTSTSTSTVTTFATGTTLPTNPPAVAASIPVTPISSLVPWSTISVPKAQTGTAGDSSTTTTPSPSVLSVSDSQVQLPLAVDEQDQAQRAIMDLMEIFDLALDAIFGAGSES
jgi:subtilase family serine protease